MFIFPNKIQIENKTRKGIQMRLQEEYMPINGVYPLY